MTRTVLFDARGVTMHGIGRVAAELLTALRAEDPADLKVVGLTAAARGTLDERLSAPARAGAVNVRARPFLPAEQVVLPWTIRKERAALLHSPHFNIPYLARVPLVLTVHDLFPLLDQRLARSAATRHYYNRLLPAAIRRADAIHCVSGYTAQSVVETIGVPESKTTVVPLGIDHAKFRPVQEDELQRVRRKLSLPTEFILSVGAAKVHKNLELLCKAWTVGLPPLVFVGASQAELVDRVGQLPPGTLVLGTVDDADLPAIYGLATLVAVPSLYEAVGLPILEAMACGTPVLASNGGGIPETAQGAAELADPHDVEAWADALQRLCGDTTLRNRLRVAGLVNAGHRTWAETAQGCLKLYRRLSK